MSFPEGWEPVAFRWRNTNIGIERRGEDPAPWVIVRGRFVLRRDAVWVLEPSPSNRTDQHIEDTRMTAFEVERLLGSLAAIDRDPD
jgi:hypothetical protein